MGTKDWCHSSSPAYVAAIARVARAQPEPPACASAANSMEYGNTEDAEFCDMRQFTNPEMDHTKHVQAGRRKESAQDRNELDDQSARR